jgi:hypothetical protein
MEHVCVFLFYSVRAHVQALILDEEVHVRFRTRGLRVNII